MRTGQEAISSNELDVAIDKIIKGIEDETTSSWEEIIQQLEDIKTNFSRMVEY